MVKKSLIFVFLIAVIYFCFQLFFNQQMVNVFIFQAVSFVYFWSPGIVALYFARKEGPPLKVLIKPNRFFWMIPLYAFGLASLGFLASIPFGGGEVISPNLAGQPVGTVISRLILFFFTSYLLIAFLFTFVFLGSELYWRGYLWDRLKKSSPIKAILWIALFWTLWQVPILIQPKQEGFWNSGLNLLASVILNFALTPVLCYARVKGKSVLAPALFYSCLLSAVLFYMLVFPPGGLRLLSITGGLTVGVVIVFSLVFKLYSPKHWNRLISEQD